MDILRNRCSIIVSSYAAGGLVCHLVLALFFLYLYLSLTEFEYVLSRCCFILCELYSLYPSFSPCSIKAHLLWFSLQTISFLLKKETFKISHIHLPMISSYFSFLGRLIFLKWISIYNCHIQKYFFFLYQMLWVNENWSY